MYIIVFCAFTTLRGRWIHEIMWSCKFIWPDFKGRACVSNTVWTNWSHVRNYWPLRPRVRCNKPVTEAAVPLKTTMAAPQEVNVAAINYDKSLCLEVRKNLLWPFTGHTHPPTQLSSALNINHNWVLHIWIYVCWSRVNDFISSSFLEFYKNTKKEGRGRKKQSKDHAGNQGHWYKKGSYLVMNMWWALVHGNNYKCTLPNPQILVRVRLLPQDTHPLKPCHCSYSFHTQQFPSFGERTSMCFSRFTCSWQPVWCSRGKARETSEL